jgi:Transposase DNA-binding
MSDGLEAELAEGQRHDARHPKRLARRLSRLRARPVSRLPTACHGGAETRAAYRVRNTPDLRAQELWSGQTHATLERLRTQAVVVLGHDPTFRHDGTTPPKAGRGTVKITTREESRRHPPVACTPARVTCGVVGLQVWQRPGPPGAQQRSRHPMAEHERDRGLGGDQGAGAVQPACPAPLVVHLAERDGELQAWLVDVRRREPGQRAACLMRAREERRLAPGAGPR